MTEEHPDGRDEPEPRSDVADGGATGVSADAGPDASEAPAAPDAPTAPDPDPDPADADADAPTDPDASGDSEIVVPEVEHPVASVVIVAYGNDELLQVTLASLVASTPPVYELVIVDNSEPGDVITVPRGARLIRNAVNVGFGAAVDQAALVCRGRMLVLLNPDIELTPGWIEELAGAMVARPDLLAVAPVLVDPDGSVQENGSVVGPDGETLALGRGPAESLATDRVARPVDFASAACLVLRLRLFLALGGFDAGFGAGYFEDVDLAYRAAERGWPVEIVPSVQVVHHRHGTTTAERAAQLMEARRGRFTDRWAADLHGRPSLTDVASRPHRLISARDIRRPDRLLVIAGSDASVATAGSDIADRRPDLAVTVVSDHPARSPRVEAKATTDVDGSWLADRRLVYPYVLLAEGTDPEIRTRVTATMQPVVELVVEDSVVIDHRRNTFVGLTAVCDGIDRLLGLCPHAHAAVMTPRDVEIDDS